MSLPFFDLQGVFSVSNIPYLINAHPIEIYPNPTSKFLHITSIDLAIHHIALFSLEGKKVWEYRLSPIGVKHSLDIRQLPANQYILCINREVESMYRQLILIH